MGRKKNPVDGKEFVQAAALILHESKMIILPEVTTTEGRFFADHLTPKGSRAVTAFKGETTGIREIFIKQDKGQLDMLVELQNGQRFTVITSENFTVCLHSGQSDQEDRPK
jgi:hypothetical protein